MASNSNISVLQKRQRLLRAFCFHSSLPKDVGPRALFRGQQQFQVRGVLYQVDVHVHMPLPDHRMIHHTIQVGIVEEGNVYSALFTTQLGGLFGCLMPMITGGNVVVTWRSGREFSALYALVNARSEFPSHVGEFLCTVDIDGHTTKVVYVPYDGLLQLLPPHLVVAMPGPVIAYDHPYVADVPLGELPDLTIHCKILPLGGVVVHGITFRTAPVCSVDVASVSAGGILSTSTVWQYTPRGVIKSDVVPPLTYIMWGMDMASGYECRCADEMAMVAQSDVPEPQSTSVVAAGEVTAVEAGGVTAVEAGEGGLPEGGKPSESQVTSCTPVGLCNQKAPSEQKLSHGLFGTITEQCFAASGSKTSDLYLDRLPKVPGGFKNLTKVDVPCAVETLLSFGPKFCVPLAPTFEQYVNQLTHTVRVAQQDHKDASTYLRGFIVKSCDWMLASMRGPVDPMRARLCQMYAQAKKFLSEQPSLCLVEGDKSKSTVLMYQTEYLAKMRLLIDGYVDRGVYEPLPDMVRVARYRKVWYHQYKDLKQALSVEWHAAGKGEKPFPGSMLSLLNKTDDDGRPLPYLYGVVKDHKPDAPCRPICSTRGWYSWALQKVITHVLSSVVHGLVSCSNVVDTTKAVHDVRVLAILPDYVFAKLDVTDMYTTMDRAEIKSVVSRLVESPVYQATTRLDGKLLMRCVELCLGDRTMFTFNGAVYRQVQGLPQGAPDSGLLACILLDHLLQAHHHQIFVNCRVVLCKKYVDDMLFYLPRTKLGALKQAMEESTSLTFTMEEEQQGVTEGECGPVMWHISFLDVDIIRQDGRILTRLYRKSMASSRTIHFLSNTPQIWKENTLQNSLCKVLDRVSNPYVIQDLQRVEMDFSQNMYPTVLIQAKLGQIIKKHLARCATALLNPGSQDHLTSLGCLEERRKLLCSYVGPNFRQFVSERSLPLKKFRLDCGGSGERNRRYARSTPFLNCEISEVVGEWHRHLSLGILTHRNANSLFELLHMSKRGPDPKCEAIGHAREGNVALYRCPDCGMSFLVPCGVEGTSASEVANLHSNSSMGLHISRSGHVSLLTQRPMIIKVGPLDHMSVGEKMAMMQAVYTALGHVCKTDRELALLPRLVRLGIDGYVRQIGNPFAEHSAVSVDPECLDRE